MKIEIIIRTHDKSSVHGNKPRYIDIPKKDLLIGCVSSLINSSNSVSEEDQIYYTILDDHSTDDCKRRIHEIFSHSKHPYKFIDLEVPGYNYSALKQFEYCKNSTADLVYSVEDDYLHCIDAIPEMLYTYKFFKSNYKHKTDLCIFPFDNPEDYMPGEAYEARVFKTPIRHWREGNFTTNTIMMKPKIFRDHWHFFEKLASEYKPWDGIEPVENLVHEYNTISHIWEKYVLRISPIPTLALHIAYELQRDVHIDHMKWWNKYSQIYNDYHEFKTP